MLRIAIIGNSGSKGRMNLFSKELFDKMERCIENLLLENSLSWNEVELWSGGSSGVDHLVVILTLKHKCNSRLFLPCEFENGKFGDNYYGRVLNDLHFKFSQKVNMDTLNQLNQVIKSGTKVSVFDGFYDRNNRIAKADILIAMTFGETIDGGTKYTWNKFTSNNKIHLNLNKINENI